MKLAGGLRILGGGFRRIADGHKIPSDGFRRFAGDFRRQSCNTSRVNLPSQIACHEVIFPGFICQNNSYCKGLNAFQVLHSLKVSLYYFDNKKSTFNSTELKLSAEKQALYLT